MPEPEDTVVETEPKVDDNWDKDRQKLDQLSANVTKLAQEKSEVASALSTMTQRSQEMLEKVQNLESQLSTAQTQRQTETEALDTDMYDDKLIKKISSFEAEIANTKKLLADSNVQVKSLLDAKASYEADVETKAENTRKAEAKEEILKDLDEEFSPKFRNEALRLAQEEVDASGIAPEGKYGVHKLLRKHYKQLSAEPPTTKTYPSVTVDTGDGGVVFNEGDIQEGSRDEVAKQIFSKLKGKPFTMPST